MSLRKISLVLAALLALGASNAFADAKFSVMGEVNMSNQTASGGGISASFDSKVGYGGGVGVEFGVGKNLGFEIDALYQIRKVGIGSFGDLSFTYITAPVGLRIHMNPNFSFFVGGYYSSAMGKIKSSLGGDGTEYDAAGYKKSDYGATAGIRLASGGKNSFFLDARYYLGLCNLAANATGDASLKWSGFQGLVGMSFGGK